MLMRTSALLRCGSGAGAGAGRDGGNGGVGRRYGRVRAAHASSLVRVVLEPTRDQAVEVLVALKNIGTKVHAILCSLAGTDTHSLQLRANLYLTTPRVRPQLTDEEKAFLDSSQDIMAKFESADKAIGTCMVCRSLVRRRTDTHATLGRGGGLLVSVSRCVQGHLHGTSQVIMTGTMA